MQSLPEHAAVRDRAERHVFGALGDLAAVERRALALVDLAGADRALAGRDTGLDAAELRVALAHARKALRRTRGPLAAGGRCEQAELLLSDQLDAAIEWRDRRWLDIHMDRCGRCREHEALLEKALADLRASFAASEAPATPKPPPAAPEQPATPEPASPPDRAAKLRVVPEPAPEPTPRTPAPAPQTRPAPPAGRHAEPGPPATREPRLPAPLVRTAKVLAVILVLAAIVFGIGYGLKAAFGPHHTQNAPWSKPGAPDVRPAPLSHQ